MWDALKHINGKVKQASGLDDATVLKLVAAGQLGLDDKISPEGAGEWQRIGDIDRFAQVAAGKPIAEAAPPPSRDDEEEEEDEDMLAPRSKEVEELDLTAMVDVTFLLVLFFMLTATYTLQNSLEVPPPKPDEKGAMQQIQTLDQLEIKNIIVRIDAENKIFVEDQEVEERNLAHIVREIVYNDGKNEMLIQADDEAHHEKVVAAMDAANTVGLQKIRLAAVKSAP